MLNHNIHVYTPSGHSTDFFSRLWEIPASADDPADQSWGEDPSLRIIIPEAASRYEAADFEVLKSVLIEFNAGVNACKQQDYPGAKRIFDAALPRIYQLSDEPKLLAETLSFPKIALYYYRTGKSDVAFELLERVIYNDDILQSAFPCLHAHKIHHLHNMARIYLTLGEYDKGIALVKRTLAYLIGGAPPLEQGLWGKTYLRTLRQDFDLGLLFWIIFSDISYKCLHDSGLEEKFSLQLREVSGLISKQKPKAGGLVYRAVHDWLHLKTARSSRAAKHLPEEVLSYLKNYSGKYDVLKISLLKQVFQQCVNESEAADRLYWLQQLNAWIGERLGIKQFRL